MAHFNPGDVVTWSTWSGPTTGRIVDGDDTGLILKMSDGHDEFWPTDAANSLGDLLGRIRHASPFDRDRFETLSARIQT